MAKSFVLWGLSPSHGPDWIKVAGGTLRECRAALRSRRLERGWSGLVIYPTGTHPHDDKP